MSILRSMSQFDVYFPRPTLLPSHLQVNGKDASSGRIPYRSCSKGCYCSYRCVLSSFYNSFAKSRWSIVKFRDRTTGINCDINVNERLGYRNTLLIKQYCTILPTLPLAILRVKQWVKAQEHLIPAINSYTVAIMMIGVLQVRCLPDLQK